MKEIGDNSKLYVQNTIQQINEYLKKLLSLIIFLMFMYWNLATTLDLNTLF